MALKNFDQSLMSQGKPITSADGEEATQKSTIWNLLMGYQKEATYEKKLKMATLANKILKGGNIDLTVPELELVREVIGILPPISLFQINESLEKTLPLAQPDKKPAPVEKKTA